MNVIAFFPSIPTAPPELCLATRRGYDAAPWDSLLVPDSCCPGPLQLITSEGPLMSPLPWVQKSYWFRNASGLHWPCRHGAFLTVLPFALTSRSGQSSRAHLCPVYTSSWHIFCVQTPLLTSSSLPFLNFLLSHFHLHLFVLCHVFLKFDSKSFPEQTTALN